MFRHYFLFYQTLSYGWRYAAQVRLMFCSWLLGFLASWLLAKIKKVSCRSTALIAPVAAKNYLRPFEEREASDKQE